MNKIKFGWNSDCNTDDLRDTQKTSTNKTLPQERQLREGLGSTKNKLTY